MSYRPTFDNNCFGANSALFILAFKGSWKPTSSNSKAMSRGLGSKGPDEWNARAAEGLEGWVEEACEWRQCHQTRQIPHCQPHFKTKPSDTWWWHRHSSCTHTTTPLYQPTPKTSIRGSQIQPRQQTRATGRSRCWSQRDGDERNREAWASSRSGQGSSGRTRPTHRDPRWVPRWAQQQGQHTWTRACHQAR